MNKEGFLKTKGSYWDSEGTIVGKSAKLNGLHGKSGQ